jgi:hypothetical protein
MMGCIIQARLRIILIGRMPWEPLMHFSNRDYFGEGEYLDDGLGFGTPTGLVTSDLLFPEETENYFLKYELFDEEYDPGYRVIPPINFFYR